MTCETNVIIRTPVRVTFFILAVLATLLLTPVNSAFAQSATIESGHTAMWFNPERSGEGWVLEVLAEDRALLYWYTYDEAGNQRWLQGVGEIERGESGDRINFPDIYITRGGEFGPNFNPDDVEIITVGSATMDFSSCDAGSFSYAAFDQSQTIPIQRLSQTMAGGCAPIHGVPGFPVQEYAGQSGSWFDVDHSGEGFSLHWLDRDEALLTWYTYDSEGNQQWMVGTGTLQDDQIIFESLNSTRGAKFGAAFDPDDVVLIDWGSLTLNMSCTTGTASYESNLDGFGSGEQSLQRLTRLIQPECPWVKPDITDLYELSWTEIPIEPDTPMNRVNIQVQSISDDGVVVAHDVAPVESKVVVWDPDLETWSELPDVVASGSALAISNDSREIVAGQVIADNITDPYYPFIWTESSGWSEIENTIFQQNVLYAVSMNGNNMVGTGRPAETTGSDPWIWSAEQGQRELPYTDEMVVPLPQDVSDDGTIAIGFSSLPEYGPQSSVVQALRWKGTGVATILKDPNGDSLGSAFACDANCDHIFGSDQTLPSLEHPNTREAWFWKADGSFGYFGSLPDAVINSPLRVYIPRASTADGSMVVGGYGALRTSNTLTSRGFIWTQDTGIVSINQLMDELDLTEASWSQLEAVDITSSGDQILIAGRDSAAILRLEKK